MKKDDKERFEVVKAMNTLMKCINNDGIYIRWTLVVPLGASDSDLMEIATDKQLFYETINLFKRLWSGAERFGLYISEDVY